ncbi:hypothetical protein NFJ02_30g77370 [Pycnococcus provasolii]
MSGVCLQNARICQDHAVEAAVAAAADDSPVGVAAAAVAVVALGDVGELHGHCSEAERLSLYCEPLDGHCGEGRSSLLEARLGDARISLLLFS